MPTEDVELGYLAYASDGPLPGVVMIHDVWGLSEHPRDLARRLAGEGFSVLAVDLYRREAEVKIEDPGAWMRALSDPQVLSDVQAAQEFLAQHPSAAKRRIGVTGFCMGGSYAILAAASCTGLSASVAFYGLLSHEHGLLHGESGPDPALKPRQPLDAVADLSCPLQAVYGDQDEFVPMSDVEDLKKRLVEAPQHGEVKLYAGCGHAFLNDTREAAYRAQQAEDAWIEMVAFFRQHLA
ncbi:MAG: dienelactone hydrolase family protein [Myxococcota bacterium]